MDTPRSDFIPALEHFWNAFASARKDVTLLRCSSSPSWVIDHAMHNVGGLYNHLTLSIHLEPFQLSETEEYVRSLGVSLYRRQILKGYMALRGIPYYWSRLKKGMSIDQYLDFLFFRRGALLKDECSGLFGSLFRQPEIFKKIVATLSQKKIMTRNEILKAAGLTSAGGASKMLRDLENCDFIRECASYWERKERFYRFVDPFILFHYHFLEPRPGDTEFRMERANTTKTSRWQDLAFEMVSLLHTQKIKNALGIGAVLTEEFSFKVPENLDEGIYGSQIDLVLKRADRITNLIEMKYSEDEYLITKASDEAMRCKRSDYQRASGSKNAVHLMLIAPCGVMQNSYAGNLASVVTGEDLFL
ncbi:ATP-binding protein [Succinimonas sp.]|uniref:AAA family ATPase n=1 Tax=Succinimonas sp. TaxID=1936151 RepID=UPI00386AFB60